MKQTCLQSNKSSFDQNNFVRMNLLLILSSLLITIGCSTPEPKKEAAFKSEHTNPDMQWFPEAKFGVFIHWLVESAPSSKDSLANETYKGNLFKEKAQSHAENFTAAKYNPAEWAAMFKSWGAQYVVLTSKHHIGFSLFQDPDSVFDAVSSSAAKRDLLKEYVDATRNAGLKVGIYFSLPDWSHPDYASLKAPEGKKFEARSYSETDDTVRWNKFVAHMFKQVRHLCTAYGKIDLIWFDGDWERTAEQWHSMELAKMIDSLQPGCIVNNRLRHKDLGHYGTPEQVVPLSRRSEDWWELCITPGNCWGLDRAGENIKPVNHLSRIFGDVIGLGGNVLMNVAPNHEGIIPQPQIDTLAKLGAWITKNKEAIFASKGDYPVGLFNGSVTRKGNILYLFTYEQPQSELVFKGIEDDVKRVTLLSTGEPLKHYYSGGYDGWKRKGWLYVDMKNVKFDPMGTIIKVEYATDSLTVRTQPNIVLY